MIANLKKSEFGHKLHRLLRGPVLAGLLRIAKAVFAQISHLYPNHFRHNSRQKEILSNFESEQK